MDLSTRSAQAKDPVRKEFSEFNYMPMQREFGYSQSKNRSINVVDSAPIVPRPEHRSQIIHKVQTSRRAPATDAKNGLLSNLGVDTASGIDQNDVALTDELGVSHRDHLIGNRIEILQSKITRYQNVNKELQDIFHRREIIEDLTQKSHNLKQRALSSHHEGFTNPHKFEQSSLGFQSQIHDQGPEIASDGEMFHTQSFNPNFHNPQFSVVG